MPNTQTEDLGGIKLENKIHAVSNPEKRDHEHHYKGRNLGNPPHPWRMVLCSRPNRGKSTVLLNILLQTQQSRKPFEELWVVTPNVESKEYARLDPTGILTEVPHVDELNPDNKKVLFIIDDFEIMGMSKQCMANLSSLFRYGSTHKNISCAIAYQTFFSIPTTIRKCSNIFLIWKTNNITELKMIAKRVDCDPDVIVELFKKVVTGAKDSLMIDLTEGTKHKYRLNVFTPIEVNEDEMYD